MKSGTHGIRNNFFNFLPLSSGILLKILSFSNDSETQIDISNKLLYFKTQLKSEFYRVIKEYFLGIFCIRQKIFGTNLREL